MSRRTPLLALVFLGWSAAANLLAQSPSPRATSAASATPTPSPTAATAAQASSTPTTKALIDSMESADLQEAIQTLKSTYINPAALNETEFNRATLEGILSRLGRGALLLPDSAADPGESPSPFFGETLEGHVGYLRLGALTRPNLDALDANLQTQLAKKIDAVVIDLRASTATNDFAVAAEFAKRFCPKGKPLFTLRKAAARQERTFTADRDPAYQGLMIVLADGDTAGAAEAVAGVLRLYDQAVMVGQPTAGRAVEYSDTRLRSGKVLRVAVGEAILPQGRPLFPGGLQPDVPVEMAAAEKREVFQQSREKGMVPFVVENERPHFNEAALISGKNPEIEAMEMAQRRGHALEKVFIHDAVLQRALDLVTSISIYQRR